MELDTKAHPDKTSLAYDEMSEDLALVRDLMGETRAMHEAGEKWLPRWKTEDISLYDVRLANTILFNGFQRSINVLTGKVFKSDIVIDVPPNVEELTANIDRAGTPIGTLGYEWFKDGLQTGISHVFVDSPSEAAATKAEEQAKGIRPYWIQVPAENLIYWRADVIAGQKRLAEIRIRETITERDGEWGEKQVDEIRQYKLESIDDGDPVMVYAIFRQNKEKNWVIVDEGQTEMAEIPLATFYARRTGYMTGKPPLMDLAWTNLAHWRSSSEQRHCLALGRRPFPAFFGFNAEDVKSIEIGPFSGPVSSNADSRVEIVEPTGAAISAGRQDLQDLKEEMAVLGLELLVRKPTQKTATESSNEQSETDSDLGGIAQDFEAAMEMALSFTAMWMGVDVKDSGGDVNVNKDFGAVVANRDEINGLIQMRQSREITWPTFIRSMMLRGVLPEDLDIEEERAALAAEGDF